MFVVKNNTGQKSLEKCHENFRIKQDVSSFKNSDTSSTAQILKTRFPIR
jgi:hypothetical protein